MDTSIEEFFEKFDKDILKQKVYTAQVIDGEMVFESFANTAESCVPRICSSFRTAESFVPRICWSQLRAWEGDGRRRRVREQRREVREGGRMDRVDGIGGRKRKRESKVSWDRCG